jgi:hypothetical protein
MKLIKMMLNMMDAGLTPEMRTTVVYMLKMRLRRTPMMHSERMGMAKPISEAFTTKKPSENPFTGTCNLAFDL